MFGIAENEHGASLENLHERANVLEVEIEVEIGRLRLQAAASSDPFGYPSVAADDALERLPSGVTLLAYHVVGEEVLAFVVSGDDIGIVQRLGTATSVRRLSRKLTVQWDRLQTGREFVNRHAALLERSARQVLAALYDELVRPLEPLLSKIGSRTDGGSEGVPKVVVVVPHGPLHQVPFHALYDGERYLLQRMEISYAPSPTAYALCNERTPCGSGRALVLGVEDPSIPAAAAEARAVAEGIPGAETLVGDAATLAAFCSQAPGCDVLHLACHGLFVETTRCSRR